ncbi:hypothetical protein [Solibacillus sp. FSL H8-0538]|uniref:hypothetical protein n=1 Tax=Solibacillus sp. FSL H8-0538 TaxID=2921400 RepID=UPI0030F9C8DF
MNIVLKESKLQFKNPTIGQPTRAVEEHYYARRIVAVVGGEDKQFRFMASEVPFAAIEEDMIAAIKEQIELTAFDE